MTTDPQEIEIKPEMIEAGLRAWEEAAGDEYPEGSFANENVLRAIFTAMAQAHPEPRPLPEDRQSPPATPQPLKGAGSLESELDRLGFLPTEESPFVYRHLGKNGFGLFLYLQGPLDLRTLSLLAKSDDRAALIRFGASAYRP